MRKHIVERLTWLWSASVRDVEGWMAWALRTPRQPSGALQRLAASSRCALEKLVEDRKALKAMGDQAHVRFFEICPDACFEKQARVFPVSF